VKSCKGVREIIQCSARLISKESNDILIDLFSIILLHMGDYSLFKLRNLSYRYRVYKARWQLIWDKKLSRHWNGVYVRFRCEDKRCVKFPFRLRSTWSFGLSCLTAGDLPCIPVIEYKWQYFMICDGRSQWQRGLRHKLSSLALALGSWVRIPLKAWMSVLCVFVLSCAGSGLETGWSPVEGALPTV
jgi:hypothetical protein